MLLGLQNVTFEFGARTIVEDATRLVDFSKSVEMEWEKPAEENGGQGDLFE